MSKRIRLSDHEIDLIIAAIDLWSHYIEPKTSSTTLAFRAAGNFTRSQINKLKNRLLTTDADNGGARS